MDILFSPIDIMMQTRTTPPTPYVLMRVYNPYVRCDSVDQALNTRYNKSDDFGALESLYYNRFERAVISAQVNKCKLVICDDTSKSGSATSKWNRHNDNIVNILKEHGFCVENNNLFFVPNYNGGCGSARAQWELRKYFLELTKNNLDAFAVLLDQDDALCNNAIKKISNKMSWDAVVISGFDVVGETERNIIGDGGNSHNSLTIMGSVIGCVLRHQPHKLSTIGWTKAYSRGAMEVMVKDFEECFTDINTFFSKNRAYEDFLDFYILLRKDIKLRSTWSATHLYFKHAASITAKPTLEAFKKDRVEMLVALANICKSNESDLREQWEEKLTTFLHVKIGEIEGILKECRKKATGTFMKPFKDTYDGWFAKCLCDKSQRNSCIDNAVEQWKDKKAEEYSKKGGHNDVNAKNTSERKWVHGINTAIWVLIAFLTVCLLVYIHWHCYIQSKHTTTSHALIISFIGIIFTLGIKNHYQTRANKKTPITPKQKQLNFIGWITTAGFILVILFLCAFEWDNKTRPNFQITITVLTTVASCIFGWINHIQAQADEEVSMLKLYYAEVDDLIRHLEANLKVIIQIRQSLGNNQQGYKPMNIHFENLKWPETSILFNDKIATIIEKSKVDDFSRLRLNIRNMNNSAEWMEQYCGLSDYSTEKMIELIDWEIWRMMAYYTNILYMKGHNWIFPAPEELNLFISSPETKEQLCSLFMSTQENEKLDKVAWYIGKYRQDRDGRREVIFR